MSKITRYGSISQDILDRIWEKIEVQNDCWIWTGSCTSVGYPYCWIHGKNAAIHIVFFEMEFGQTNLIVGHTNCYERLCVSPFHKTAQTRSENMLDEDRLDTGNAEYYFCGHPRTSANTVGNAQRCRICHNKLAREAYRRKHGIR